jgi:uncharacterized protein
LKQELLLLHDLQAIDLRLQEIRKSMEALPEKLKPIQQDLAKLEAMLAQEKGKLAEAESWRREQEIAVKSEEEALRKAKTKLQASRNTKDYAAANRELENKRRSVSEKEEELLKVIEALEATKSGIPAHEHDVETLRAHLAREEAECAARVAELAVELDKSGGGRDEIAAKVDPRTLKRYELVQRKRGVAVVPVEGGMCTGCHMSLPPQLNNVLARNESIEACPRCQRLIYRAELLAEGDGAPS